MKDKTNDENTSENNSGEGLIETQIKKFKMLVVESEEDFGYCHNSKCHLYNVGIGSCGHEEGDRPKCPACYKRLYTTTDGTGEIGDCEVDI